MKTPEHVAVFEESKWDVFRLNVLPSTANHDRSGFYARARYHATLLQPHVAALRQQGYKRIALAGYSGGAMGVLLYGTMEEDIDAVFAVAPCCGVGRRQYISSGGFYSLLEDFKARRVMIFFFEGERHAPDAMGAQAEQILRRNGVTYRIYDHPDGFSGHTAGLNWSFANNFSQEMIEFAGAAEVTESKREAGSSLAFLKSTKRPVSMEWPRFFEGYSGVLELGTIQKPVTKFRMQIPKKKGSCEGSLTSDTEDSTTGDWRIICDIIVRGYRRIVHARGSYAVDGRTDGMRGIGKDMAGHNVSFVIGSAG